MSLTPWVTTYFVMPVFAKLLELVSSVFLNNVKSSVSFFSSRKCLCQKKMLTIKKLTSFVVMPLEINICFNLWWKDLPIDHEVAVRYPFERHGLAGKVSNNAKTDTKDKFLEFVDTNSQPNSCRLDSCNRTHYFLPKFTTISARKRMCTIMTAD